jgi:YD repeat-containing protein
VSTTSHSFDSQTVVRGASTLLNHTYSFAGANGKRTGQLVSITNNLDTNKNRKYEYDAVGRLQRATGGQNVNWAQRYEYDRYGNRSNAYSFTAEQYVRNFYQNELNRQPNATELQNKLSTLQSAYTQGLLSF